MRAISAIRTPFILLAIFTSLTGVVYPAVITLLSQTLFAEKASGSVSVDMAGFGMGSELIGQNFSSPKYFWGRLSATPEHPYNPKNSAGSSLSFQNPALEEQVKKRVELLKKVDPKNETKIPVDLVTASASGLDPHISIAAAEYQLKRVARARKLEEEKVRQLIQKNTEGRQFVFLGEPRVNVLKLNVELDKLSVK